MVIIPLPNEVLAGVYWIHFVRPSVCPSARLSVRPSVDSQISKTAVWNYKFDTLYERSCSWDSAEEFFRDAVTPRPVTRETLPDFEQFSHFFMCRQPFLQTGCTESQALYAI